MNQKDAQKFVINRSQLQISNNCSLFSKIISSFFFYLNLFVLLQVLNIFTHFLLNYTLERYEKCQITFAGAYNDALIFL